MYKQTPGEAQRNLWDVGCGRQEEISPSSLGEAILWYKHSNMSKVSAYYHIVFCTKNREKTIPLNYKNDLYGYIWSLIRELKCSLVRIGGVENHFHVLVNLNPTVSLSDFVRSIKAKSSIWLNSDSRFPLFKGWAAEYFACTVAPENKDGLITYIRDQEVHHQCKPIASELETLYRAAELSYHPKDMM